MASDTPFVLRGLRSKFCALGVQPIFLDIEKVREEARQKENRYLEIISQYEEQLKKYKEELHIYQRREEANQKTSKAEEARKGIRGQGSTDQLSRTSSDQDIICSIFNQNFSC